MFCKALTNATLKRYSQVSQKQDQTQSKEQNHKSKASKQASDQPNFQNCRKKKPVWNRQTDRKPNAKRNETNVNDEVSFGGVSRKMQPRHFVPELAPAVQGALSVGWCAKKCVTIGLSFRMMQKTKTKTKARLRHCGCTIASVNSRVSCRFHQCNV